ncbi:SRPBCC family protein [Microbacterium sp.]|uniref:SRPBCC family protein n=1 Tax=Microbacterium sp. TaxID=51671 RepID=UPI0039E4E36C
MCISARIPLDWSVWSDPDSFPSWDPREQRTELTGPFAAGSTIRSRQRGIPQAEMTVTEVAPGERWTIASALPGGTLTFEHTLVADGPGRTRVTKLYEVSGPMSLAFRCYFGPRVRKAMPDTFRALEAEALRRG